MNIHIKNLMYFKTELSDFRSENTASGIIYQKGVDVSKNQT